MKKTALTLALAALLIAAPMTFGGNKATICHVPPGNPANAHTISVSENALKAHLGNNLEGLHGGDSYGPCETAEPTPTPEPTPAPTPTPSGPTPTQFENSPSPTIEPTPSPTPEVTPSPTPEPSVEPTPEPTPTPEPSETPAVTLPPTDTE